MTLQQRKKTLIVVGFCVLIAVSVMYRSGRHFIEVVHTHAYTYSYFPSKTIRNTVAATGEPAIAVPILMYHGVRVEGELGTNITRANFIAQMEMLKEKGYQTISVAEFDLFQQGKFELPAKPIVLTFDDGRKDSFYTVDEVLRKLGFKATIFIATIKTDSDPFFLGWSELENMKLSGRWEIEAHGQHSHDEVVIDNNGKHGRYLTSRIYDDVNGLESIEDFNKRVEDDYKNGAADLSKKLGVNSRYYAVPLNDYGNIEESNHDMALEFNKEMTKRYFKLAFIEILDANNKALETFYNYRDSDPYALKRLEAKNMTAEDLKFSLEKYRPQRPEFVFPYTSITDSVSDHLQLLYGNFRLTPEELIVNTGTSSTVARILVGDRGWKNYELTTVVSKGDSQEASIVLSYLDEDNLIILDWEDLSFSLTERVNGVNTSIVERRSRATTGPDSVSISTIIKDGYLSVMFEGNRIVTDYLTHIPRGAVGFGVWDPEGGEVKVTSLEVRSVE